jgi:polysaccharide export outer membrane protein
MRRHSLCIACRMLVVPLAIAAVSVASARDGFSQPLQPPSEGCAIGYVIGPEDVLDIAVWDNKELTHSVPVRPDGRISLPLLNDVTAAGLTPMQLREILTKALTAYIPRPAVSVLVKEIHSVKVAVIGQVKTPGRYELKDRATVLDVLAMAGGLNEYAARSRIVVLRQQPAGTRQIPFPYDKLTAKDGSRSGSKPGAPQNFCVQPGDVVLVP